MKKMMLLIKMKKVMMIRMFREKENVEGGLLRHPRAWRDVCAQDKARSVLVLCAFVRKRVRMVHKVVSLSTCSKRNAYVQQMNLWPNIFNEDIHNAKPCVTKCLAWIRAQKKRLVPRCFALQTSHGNCMQISIFYARKDLYHDIAFALDYLAHLNCKRRGWNTLSANLDWSILSNTIPFPMKIFAMQMTVTLLAKTCIKKTFDPFHTAFSWHDL